MNYDYINLVFTSHSKKHQTLLYNSKASVYKEEWANKSEIQAKSSYFFSWNWNLLVVFNLSQRRSDEFSGQSSELIVNKRIQILMEQSVLKVIAAWASKSVVYIQNFWSSLLICTRYCLLYLKVESHLDFSWHCMKNGTRKFD